jgi:hypothetical protein
VTAVLVLISVLLPPYLAFNIRRLRRGRSWAFSFCHLAREWQEGEHAKLVARRNNLERSRLTSDPRD